MTSSHANGPVRTRLLKAALDCFLAEDYHLVTTRRVAEAAGTNVSMIRYYFGSKAGLYEQMIRETMAPLLESLDGPMFSSVDGFGALFSLYYRTMITQPEFPKLLLKVLALNQGPGRQVIRELLERGRARGGRRVDGLKAAGQVGADFDPDIVRMAFVSLAVTPMLLKGVFEEQMGQPMAPEFLDALADFNGRLFLAGLRPATED